MPRYRVDFANLTGCAIGISDYHWGIVVTAESQEAALELAVSYADELSRTTGIPPYGLRIDEDELRRHACVDLVST